MNRLAVLDCSIEDLLVARIRDIGPATGEKIDNEQRHLDEGTKERKYWHHGYASALKDVLTILQGANRLIN
jgi:hypothetical protein